jgi:hypothetical protein
MYQILESRQADLKELQKSTSSTRTELLRAIGPMISSGLVEVVDYDRTPGTFCRITAKGDATLRMVKTVAPLSSRLSRATAVAEGMALAAKP